MSTEALIWYVGDKSPSITQLVSVDGEPVDLDSLGATVVFNARPIGAAAATITGSATIVEAGSGDPDDLGIVQYDWASDDLDTAGNLIVWWEVTISGATQTVGESLIEVRDHGPFTGALCELADVRGSMETETVDTALDPLIQSYILTASALIQQETQREFAVTGSATRDFEVCSRLVDLAPFDLRSASSVTLNPLSGSTTLVAGTDYRLRPINGRSLTSTYTALELAGGVSLVSTELNGTVAPRIRIVGTWGPASVPLLARDACTFTVRSWLRRSYPDGYNLGESIRDLEPGEALSGFAIPLAAKQMLAPLYRFAARGSAG